MSRPILLLDVDGVIADCETAIHDFAQDVLERDLPLPATWTDFAFEKSMGMSETETTLFYNKCRHEFDPRTIKLFPYAHDVIFDLKEIATVVFCTSPWEHMFEWMPVRAQLLAPFSCGVVHTHDKWLIGGDYLLDDKFETIQRGSSYWKGLLWDRPWNHKNTCPEDAERVYTWDRVVEILKEFSL